MNKRDRSDVLDRDANELQQRRLNPRQQQGRTTNWRASRRSPDFTENYTSGSTGLLQSMEFDIQPDMVGAVIGKGGTTARAIRSRTGANVHVHSPTTESPRTYVELRGRREQIEAAFEELRTVVSSVDEEFAKQMQASVTLKTKPETVGCLIGKQGQNIKQIEEETRARVRVEAHEEGEEFQCVHVSGEVAAVEFATRLVQESLERYDATRIKKQFPIPMTSHRVQQQQKVVETKTLVQDQIPKTENDSTVPPIYIHAPAGGFAPHPAVLVLQADGTYHPAQVVTAYDGGVNAPGLVTVVAQQGLTSIPGIIPQSQPVIDGTGQRLSTFYPNLNTAAVAAGVGGGAAAITATATTGTGLIQQGSTSMQTVFQPTAGGLIPTTIPMTQAQVPQLTVAGNQHPILAADNFIQTQQQHQQPTQTMQVYDFTMTRPLSQACPELSSITTLPNIGGTTMGFDPSNRQQHTAIPVSIALNNSLPQQQSSNLPSAT